MFNFYNRIMALKVSIILLVCLFFYNKNYCQTPVPMASQVGLSYTENFDSIANWTNNFASGYGANRWRSVATSGGTGTTAAGTLINVSSATFNTGTTSGIQKGTGNIKFLAGVSSQVAIEFLVDFNGVVADSLVMDVSTINNSTGSKASTFKIFYKTINSSTFQELSNNTTDYNATNNVVNNQHLSYKLPSTINDSSVIFRFYDFSGSGAGNFPFIALDNVNVTGQSRNTSSYFRSKMTGNWTDSSIWQASSDSSHWCNTIVYPTSSAKAVNIRTGDTVTISADVSAKRLYIESGGILTYDNSVGIAATFSLNISDTTGADLVVAGTYELFGRQPSFASGTIAQIINGGVVKVLANNSPGNSDNFAQLSNVYFATGAVFDWSSSSQFSSNGAIYFPNALSTELPIFRVSIGVANIGSATNTRFNGVFNAVQSVSFSNTGIKYFRNGITGVATITQTSGSGNFVIDGDTAILSDAAGKIELATGGTLTIASNTKAVLTSDKFINIGSILVNGVLKTSSNRLFGTGAFYLNTGGSLYIGSVGGISLSGSSGNIQMTGRNYGKGGNYYYYGTSNQITGLGLPDTVKGILQIENTGTTPTNLVTLSNPVKVGTALNVRSGVLKLNNKDITLLSDSNATANFGKIGTGGSVAYDSGRFVVERYIATGVGAGHHSKSWQLLSTPTNNDGQSIKAAWQENATSSADNPFPGYGIQISSNVTNATSVGFDVTSPIPSMKYYNATTNQWNGVSNTTGLLYNSKGYMVFVRGNRLVTNYAQAATPTILRSRGYLLDSNATANITPVSVSADKYESIGNPYASIIDFSKLTRSGGVQDIFYLWDPKLTSAPSSPYGYGGYQTFTSNGNGTYHITPGGGGFSSNDIAGLIQSGSAFFVHATGSTGTIGFSENAKSEVTSTLFNRSGNSSRQRLNVNLNVISSTDSILLDGTMLEFESDFSNQVDIDDAIKLTNSGENISIVNQDKYLVVERRAEIQQTDTIYVSLSQLKQKTYLLQFTPQNINTNGLQGILIDKYLHTQTNIDLQSNNSIQFSVNSDSASASNDRFYIVFQSPVSLPVSMISLQSTLTNHKTVSLSWKVVNEINVSHYIIERSTDGIHFNQIGNVIAKNVLNYQYCDSFPTAGMNYYRVYALEGNIDLKKYSNVTNIFIKKDSPFFTIYPNPIKEKTLHLYFNKSINTTLQLEAYDINGRLLQTFNTPILNKNNIDIMLDKHMPAGFYQLLIFVDNTKYTTQIIVD